MIPFNCLSGTSVSGLETSECSECFTGFFGQSDRENKPFYRQKQILLSAVYWSGTCIEYAEKIAEARRLNTTLQKGNLEIPMIIALSEEGNS